jgi:Na+/pantothenate symporter
MKAWHVRLVTTNGGAVSQARALTRYALSWLWFVPALLALYLSPIHSAPPMFAVMVIGVLTYAALARLHPQRQFWHDAVCGTRLVTWRPAQRT